MSELGDVYSTLKRDKQDKKADNRTQSAEYLRTEQVLFTEHNHGAHLVVEGRDCYIDFWPGTGKWITRDGEKGFGVRNLVNFIKH